MTRAQMKMHKEMEAEYKLAPELALLLQPAVSQCMHRSSGCVKTAPFCFCFQSRLSWRQFKLLYLHNVNKVCDILLLLCMWKNLDTLLCTSGLKVVGGQSIQISQQLPWSQVIRIWKRRSFKQIFIENSSCSTWRFCGFILANAHLAA